nr:Toll/interleukin-1 receptor (TIR) domain-containing protein [Tanacetum cinerariifolium]
MDDEEFEPKYPEENFRRRYRMSSTLFNKIVNKILSYDVEPIPEYFTYFTQRYDATGRLSIGPIMKCTSAIRQLAYGIVPDAFDKYLQIAERASRECLDNFTKCIHVLFAETFLRKPTRKDIEKTYQLHEQKHGLLRMLGSIDCDVTSSFCFSKTYASSSWCLDELVKIIECQKKIPEQTAYPVFFDVEPTHVRNQNGPVGEAFSKHQNHEAAGKWRHAMKELADLAGWELKATANG